VNSLLAGRRLKSTSRSRVIGEHLPQRASVFGATCFLLLSGTAGALILGHALALAQPARPTAQNANATIGNAENTKKVAAPAQASTAPALAGNADNGKQLFARTGCYECHDRQGQGGTGTGPRLAPNPIPFSAFVHQCRQPVDEMPPYTSKVLSDAQLADIYAFLQSVPKPPAAASIPLLQ
jgi:cytochrome c553